MNWRPILVALSLVKSLATIITELLAHDHFLQVSLRKSLVKTDLPEPDSPTKAKTSPSTKSRETPRIAAKTRSRTSNSTTISRADNITFYFVILDSYLCVRGSLDPPSFGPTIKREGNEDQGSQWNPEEISIDCNVLCIV